MGSALQDRLQGRLHIGGFIRNAQLNTQFYNRYNNPLCRQMNKTPVAAAPILPNWTFPHATFDSRATWPPF
ncbi:MAG: hypothetical protein ACJARR_000126 [Pseudophaeobacter arcticus]|jgi:hypothetical protein